MKQKVAARLGAWLFVLLFTSSALCAQSYVVIDIGGLRAGSTIAQKINLAGQVVGHSGTLYGANNRAFIRTGNRLVNLGTLPAGDSSSAFDINKGGAVVGESNTATVVRAFLWDATSGLQDLGTVPGDTGSRAFGINDSNQVVGLSSGPNGERAFLWTRTAGMTSLGTLPGGSTSEAYAINNAGTVVGFSTTSSGDKHAFLWTSAGMQDLGTLPGDNLSEARRINDSGDVIGSSVGPSGTHAFLWTASGGIQSLGNLGGDFSDALGLNNNGDVVGTSNSAQGARAFHWSNKTGMQDLNTLIPANSGIVLRSAIGINNIGLIVAIGLANTDTSHPLDPDDTHGHAGSIHAFLLIPASGTTGTFPRQLSRTVSMRASR